MHISELFNGKEQNFKIEGVIALGKVTRYVQLEGINLYNPEKDFIVEIELLSLRFEKDNYGISTAIDNSVEISGTLYAVVHDNKDLVDHLVTIRDFRNRSFCGVSLRKSSLNGNHYYSCFKFLKENEKWFIGYNAIEIYNPKSGQKEDTFKALSEIFEKKNGLIEPNSAEKAFKDSSLQTAQDLVFKDDSILEMNFNPSDLVEYAETKLKNLKTDLIEEGFDFIVETEDNMLRSTLVSRMRVCLKDDLKEIVNKFEDKLDSPHPNEELLDFIIQKVTGTQLELSKFIKLKEKFFDYGNPGVEFILQNPYIFSLLFGGLSAGQCDKLAHILQLVGYPVNTAHRMEFLVLNEYKSESNDTIVSTDKLKNRIVKKAQDKKFSVSSRIINHENFMPQNLDESLDLSKYFEHLKIDGKNIGYISYEYLFKESYILKTVLKRNEVYAKEVSKEKIKDIVSKLPFQLEEGQLKAVNSCDGGIVVISGCAGSGKTTIANTIAKAMGEGSISYACPTGKAARRLSESTGEPARTIHSLFKLNIGGSGFVTVLEDRNIDISIGRTLIIDEAAMVNLDVMYQVLKRLEGEKTKIILMGDPNQLLPIGKGAVFRDMVKLFNNVPLGVSKRFANGSGVGLNCKAIVDGDTHLIAKDDFIIEDMELSLVPRNIVKRFFTLLKEYSLDDVQIATPYRSDKFAHSSSNLNKTIQDQLFNPEKDEFLCSINNISIYKGTKVLQSGVNFAEKPHYKYDPLQQKFISLDSIIGTFNGDVGYVVDLIDTRLFTIDDKAAKDNFGDGVQDDFSEGKDFAVVVQLGEDDFVLYPCIKKGEVVYGTEVYSLDLAYALTVHKLQGSEYKVVLFPYSSSRNSNFVSNEMVYTAISRAKKRVEIFGETDKIPNSLKNRVSGGIKTLMGIYKC